MSSIPSFVFNKYLILFAVASYSYYKYLTWNFGIFKKLKVKGPKPWPGIGNLYYLLSRGYAVYDFELRDKYGPVVGIFSGRMPSMLVFDTDMLQQIMIKQFDNFSNRIDLGFTAPPLDKSVALLKDEEWRSVRATITPSFSSAKLRNMAVQMNECCDTLCSNLEHRSDSSQVFDFKEVFGAFTMDVIASTAFGVQIDSHNDPNNEFVKVARRVFNLTLSPILLIFIFCPILLKPLSYLGFSVLDQSVVQFFIQALQKAIEQRDSKSKRTDFLQLMLDCHKDPNVDADDGQSDYWKDGKHKQLKKGLTHDQLLAQGTIFFLVGYETVANTLSFFAHCMATNQSIQSRLYEEIRRHFPDGTNPDYDSINKLTYLDMCLNECLRMYPAGFKTDRVTKRDTVIKGQLFPKGMTIFISIYALQNDPQYWHQPRKYNPERFSAEEKDKVDPFRFMPFGAGPRKCIAMRLALMEMKMALVRMLRDFKVLTSPETQIELKLMATSMRAVDGIKLRVEKRNNF